MTNNGRWEFIEHTADIAIKAYGDKLEDAFATAAGAMFHIMTDNSTISPLESVEFVTESVDMEGLLVGFLSNLIVLHEVQNIVMTGFKITFESKRKLKVTAAGEKFDKQKHAYGHHIKGVSYHMMEISDGGDKNPSFVQVLFDV